MLKQRHWYRRPHQEKDNGTQIRQKAMSKHIRLLVMLLSTLLAGRVQGQIISSPHSSYGGHEYTCFSIKITPEEAPRFSIVENPGGLSHQAFVASQQAGAPFLLINAGTSDKTCHPLGYFVMNSAEQSPINQATGEGNFYLKPNGAFLVTATDVEIVESSRIAAQTGVVYGVQSGPLLIDNKTINPAFGASSVNRRVRCGVGTSTLAGAKYVYFVISNEEVSFYELASFFQEKLKCASALCLESVGCDMYSPERDVDYNAGGAVICRYIKYTVE